MSEETAIYIRTSTEEQNPELQLKDCKSLIKEKGQFIVFMDKQSAWKDHVERVEFGKLKKAIKQRAIKNLIVWDLDRIYRNRANLRAFFEFCKAYGCKIHSYRQKWLESLHKIQPPFDEIMHDLMLQIMGWLAEEESTKKSDRVKSAVRKGQKGTYSYKGKKWGRKSISTQKLNQIKELQGLSIRNIAKQVGLSSSAVHKYLGELTNKKTLNKGVH